MSFKSVVFGCFLILLLLTRFIKLDWGDGYFFHPDEGNMARSVAQLSTDDLNPRFFAYGQFPLYLAFFTGRIFLNRDPTFSDSIFLLRFYSASFSLLAILFFYCYSRLLKFSPKTNLTLLLLLIFSPGLIQQAHFGTTESILIFVLAANLYLSGLFLAKAKLKYVFLASLVSGIGIASKISALVLTLPIFLALIKKFKISNYKLWLTGLFFSLSFIFFAIGLSPYSLINYPEFLSTFRYESAVATGLTPVFYTKQFIGTIPYLFQFTKVFPYTAGLTVFILFFICLPVFVFNLKKFTKYQRQNILIMFVSVLVYFLYFGQLFTKWTRFMSPIFFFFPFIVALSISRFKLNLFLPLVIFSIIPGLFFMQLYLRPDIRLVASQSINQLPASSNILSEAGNVVDIPLPKTGQFTVTNFDFYGLDSKPEQISKLFNQAQQSDYILIPSRRMFSNGFAPDYYQALFSGQLGFDLKQVWTSPSAFLLDPEKAEETFSVFDHPTIRLYEKQK